MAIDPTKLKGEIALQLDAEKVTASDFSLAVESFLSLVRELTREINEKLPKDSWYVAVQEGSQVLSIAPNSQRLPEIVSNQIIGSLIDGIDGLRIAAVTPKNFTVRALEKAQAISKLTVGNTSRDIPISIITKQRSCNISPQTFRNISQLIEPDFEDLGTVEGSLEVVSAHNGYEFRVYEPVWSRAIRCTFSEELLPLALGAFKKRIEVTGQVKYAKSGFPVSVKASSIYVFPDSDTLPSYLDVRGILENPGGAR